jgi:hypothetical protein
MKWDELRSILNARLVVARVALPAGRVLAAESAIDLQEALEAVTESEADAEELDASGTDYILREARLLDRLVSFQWDGLGATSWAAWIELLHLGGSRSFACWLPEDDESKVIAALEPLCPVITGAFLSDLVPKNGSSYGVWMFGGLPTLTVNHRPDLIATTVVRECYWEWMRSASARDPALWASLRDSVIAASETPNPLHRTRRVLEQLKPLGTPATTDSIGRYLGEGVRAGRAISDSERRLIFDNYFAVSYTEQS